MQAEYVTLNEFISAKVIECDEIKHKLKLSIKRIKKPSKQIIKEVGEGFGILEASLPEWIRNKQIEMNINEDDQKDQFSLFFTCLFWKNKKKSIFYVDKNHNN